MSQSLNFSTEEIEGQTRSRTLIERQLRGSFLAEREIVCAMPPPLIPLYPAQEDQIPINIFTGNQSVFSESDNSSISSHAVPESDNGSPTSKKARLSNNAGEGEMLMTVALAPCSDDDHWEVPDIETIDSMMNKSLKEYEGLENIGSKLETELGDLKKKIEGIAAASLPFAKDTLEDKKNSDGISHGLEKKEVDIQVDLPSEEEIAKMAELRKLVDEQQRSLRERAEELETVNKTLKQREIGFAAATTLLGLSFEECVKNSAAATIARTATVPLPPALPAPTTPLSTPGDSGNSTNSTNSTNLTPISRGRISNPITLEYAQASTNADAAQPRILSNQPTPSAPASYGIAKNEYSRLNRRNFNGVYEDAFPLQPELIQRFATGSSAAEFVKLVLEHCYTDSYLETHTLSRMNEAHVEEITNVTMKHFTEFRTRKDTIPQTMNRPQVRTFITTVLTNRKAAARKRSSK